MDEVYVVTSRNVREEMLDGEWVHAADTDDIAVVEGVYSSLPSADTLVNIRVRRENDAAEELEKYFGGKKKASVEICVDIPTLTESIVKCAFLRVYISVSVGLHNVQ